MIAKADVVVGLQYGDEAKGKVTHHLCRVKDYTHVLRFNGGCNAGHTIYHEGEKFVTHHIPAGVFFGVKSIIGSGCVVNVKQFLKEIDELESAGLNVRDQVFIATNAHVITNDHIMEEASEKAIGTTKRGNGPAYRDKYARQGVRAENVPELKEFLIDLYEEFYSDQEVHILCEGAQGFGLDIDHGNYPFVTSSHCTTAGALLNGISHKQIKDVWGVAKIYQTYVGTNKFEPDDEIFEKIRYLGEEYGATTGRPRQCNWLDVDQLQKAIAINGVTKLVLNKFDVLRRLAVWKLIKDGTEMTFEDEFEMGSYLKDHLNVKEVYFSDNKNQI
jgi:adenylosuccinate synthase